MDESFKAIVPLANDDDSGAHDGAAFMLLFLSSITQTFPIPISKIHPPE
jgi:hypothetical protein